MLKTIAKAVIVTVAASVILSMLAYSPFDFNNKDDEEKTASTTTILNSPGVDAPEEAPGCDEDLGGSAEPAQTTARTTSAPQIDYGWSEEPGPS